MCHSQHSFLLLLRYACDAALVCFSGNRPSVKVCVSFCLARRKLCVDYLRLTLGTDSLIAIDRLITTPTGMLSCIHSILLRYSFRSTVGFSLSRFLADRLLAAVVLKLSRFTLSDSLF